MSADDYMPVPPRHIATVVTFLEMNAPAPAFGEPDLDRDLSPLRGRDVERYLAAFRELGERWLWFSRLQCPRAEIVALLDHPDVAAFEVRKAGEAIGLMELDFRVPGEAELAFFGLFEGHVGQGHGRWLMDRAVALAFALAFARKVRRLFVHTCTADHPSALTFYRRCGFAPYRLAIEIAPDPRLSGVLSQGAVPHLPIIDG
jgi:GNAT superfamily N-acetyltransferase